MDAIVSALLGMLPAGGTFAVLGLIIVQLLRQQASDRTQTQEHFARISKENAELRADLDTERDRRMAAEEEASALRRRHGLTEGTS